ncbi:MAG: hypothetical protein A2138_06645, partial [Deltaproteobacteria bacterium RBG_16_71_12]
MFDGLNPAQRVAVMHDRGPLLVLAGAGTGKTRVVTTRIARLLRQGEAPRSILAVTFTNKAAREMKARLVGLAGRAARGVWVSTFHSLCARLLRKDAHQLGLSNAFAILDEGDQQAQLVRVARAVGMKLDEAAPGVPASRLPRLVLGRIGLWKNQGVRPTEDPPAQHDEVGTAARALWRPYAAHLRSMSALDFDDLLLCTRELLETVAEVRARYQRQFRWLHIDEYQDTNPLQLDITRLVCGPEQNLCVVGDDDQAIYAFRGADLENILAFDRQFTPCTVVKLEDNYRSTALILDAANAVIAKNRARRDKTLRSGLGDGAPLSLVAAEDGEAEAEQVAARIFDLVVRDHRPADSIALLYRAAPQSRLFEEALRLRGVPYRVVGGMEFFARKEVKDALAYLACVARPDDEIAFRRAVTAPARKIGDVAVGRIVAAARARGRPIVEYAAQGAPDAELKDDQRAALCAFAGPLVAARTPIEAAADDPGGDAALLAHRVVLDAGMARLFAAEPELATRQRMQESVEEVMNAFAVFVERRRDAAQAPDLAEGRPEEEGAGALAAFLDRVRLDDEEDQRDDDDEEKQQGKGKVQLMSLHASKGLEFPVVFVVGMEEGLLPHRRVVEESGERGVEEERRLCYVGFTRAQRSLVCSFAKTRRRRHELLARRRSRFLD